MLSGKKLIVIIISTIIFINSLTVIAQALEFSSYIFTTEDIIFFSYKDETQVEIYNSNAELIWDNNGVLLKKGEHAIADINVSQGIYMVTGSNKFSVLTGDPTDANLGGISGYYAMDANGLGVSTEFYTYVPEESPHSGHQLFIVFAYEPNTTVTVQEDVNNGDYQNVDTFTLNKGQHWADPNLSNKYLHVISDKPVSALTCHDQGYFVPSANGKWSGTLFYTYVGDIGVPWAEDLTVIAYDNGTSVIIKDSNDPNIVIWSGTLNSGQAHVVICPQYADLNAYYTIESSKAVTVSVQPWFSWQSIGYEYGLFNPDRDGTGIGGFGSDIIGSTINDSYKAYLYILAHTDNTHVELYNSQTGSPQSTYTLNEGESVNANPGHGLWRIVSDRYVSAYSGYDNHTAEFAPLAFDAKAGLFALSKMATFEGYCVEPGDYITYTISYDANGHSDTNVVITDYLPQEVIPDDPFIDSNYDPASHTYTWNIGTLAPNDANSVILTVVVNELAEPLSTFTNYCEIESDQYISFAAVDTNVCCWNTDIIYVDISANGLSTGMTWENAYTDLQSALERARNCYANQIWVAEGTYRPTQNPYEYDVAFELVDNVAIYGGFPSGGGPWWQRNPTANETILDGDLGDSMRARYVVAASNVTDAVLDGFTVKHGDMAGLHSDASSMTVKNSKITESGLASPAGIYCSSNSSLNISNSEISDNYSTGIYFDGDELTVTNCLIADNNSSYSYGGIYCYADTLTVTNCIFSGNRVGIYNTSSSSLITNSLFTNNSAYNGGGIFNSFAIPAIRNCVFVGNSADNYGGGIYNDNYASPTLTNCTFISNHANKGGGIFNYYNSSPNVTNSIFWDNTATQDGNEIYNCNDNCDPNFTYCDIEGGLNGPGCGGFPSNGHNNINADPCFYDPDDPNEYHLGPNSLCIDAGDPNFQLVPGETDLDGEDRVIDGDSNGTKIVDIGADEYYKNPADFDNNDIVNFIDYCTLANAWLSELGEDDYNEICDLAENDVIDYNDLALFCEDWLWHAGWAKTFGAGIGRTIGGGMGLLMLPAGETLAPAEETFSSEPSQQRELTVSDIEELIIWAEEIWRTKPEVRKSCTQDEWQEFIDLLKQELQRVEELTNSP